MHTHARDLSLRSLTINRDRSARAEFSSVVAEFTADRVVTEMADHIGALGRAGRNTKEGIALAARRAGLTYGQAKRLKYREWSVVPAYVADRIRAARQRYPAPVDPGADMEARIARLEAILHREGQANV